MIKIPFTFPEISSWGGEIYSKKKKEILEELQVVFMVTCESGKIIEGMIKFDPYNRNKSGNAIKTTILKDRISGLPVYAKYSGDF